MSGGSYNGYTKILNGVYCNTITIGRTILEPENGIVAGGFFMDWGPDGECFQFDVADFKDNAEKLTGYPYNHERNIMFREAFRHCNRIIGYKLNSSGGKKAKHASVGEAKDTGIIGNQIKVSVHPNINDETQYVVNTYKDNQLIHFQSVPEAGIDEVVLTKGDEKAGTAVETADATFTFKDNTITVAFSNVPEGYKPSVRVKGQVGILGFLPGKFYDTELSGGNKHIITYNPGAPINGTMTIEAVLTKDKVTVLKSCTYTCQLNEDVVVGADCTKLKDNDYVIFNKEGVLEENTAYVFTGGKTGTTITLEDHSNFLNNLEGRRFNELFCESKTPEIKQLYCEYTKRQRDEKGYYFRTWVGNYPDADYWGVTNVYNTVTDASINDLVGKNSNVVWLAGYASALPLNNELTEKTYDGELTIDVSNTDDLDELLVTSGYFVFNRSGFDEVKTRIDVNSYQSFTTEHDKQLNDNKVVRVVDYIHNTLQYEFGRRDKGNNTEINRNLIWAITKDVLQEMNDQGIIEGFLPEHVVVEPVTDQKDSVKILISIYIPGYIRKIYIETDVYEVLTDLPQPE